MRPPRPVRVLFARSQLQADSTKKNKVWKFKHLNFQPEQLQSLCSGNRGFENYSLRNFSKSSPSSDCVHLSSAVHLLQCTVCNASESANLMGTKEPRACQTHWHQNAISLSYLTPTRINPGHLWQRTRLTARLTKSLKSLTCTLASVGWLAHQFGLANRVARREAHGEKIARILMALTSPVNPVALTNLAPV